MKNDPVRTVTILGKDIPYYPWFETAFRDYEHFYELTSLEDFVGLLSALVDTWSRHKLVFRLRVNETLSETKVFVMIVDNAYTPNKWRVALSKSDWEAFKLKQFTQISNTSCEQPLPH